MERGEGPFLGGASAGVKGVPSCISLNIPHVLEFPFFFSARLPLLAINRNCRNVLGGSAS